VPARSEAGIGWLPPELDIASPELGRMLGVGTPRLESEVKKETLAAIAAGVVLTLSMSGWLGPPTLAMTGRDRSG
jgi:hypothetical protein